MTSFDELLGTASAPSATPAAPLAVDATVPAAAAGGDFAMGGGFDGADRFDQSLSMWGPVIQSADAEVTITGDGTGGRFKIRTIYSGQPINRGFFNHNTATGGHFAAINFKHSRASTGVFCHRISLAHNVWCDQVPGSTDGHNDPKASYKFRITNYVSRELLGGGHNDAMQFYFIHTMGVIEDFDCADQSNFCHGLLFDGLGTGGYLKDYAFIRMRVGSNGVPVYSMGAPMYNCLHDNPVRTAGNIGYGFDSTKSSWPCRATRFIIDNQQVSNISKIETSYMPGVSFLYPTTTEEPLDAPAATDWDAANPLAVFDTQVGPTVFKTAFGSYEPFGTSLRVYRIIDAKDPGQYFEMPDEQPTLGGYDRRRPLWEPTGFNGNPQMVFDGDNTGGAQGSYPASSGSCLSAESTTYNATPNALLGTSAVECWTVMDFQHPTSDTSTSTFALRYIWSLCKNDVAFIRYYASGAQRLKVQTVTKNGSATKWYTASDLTFTPSLGKMIVRVQFLTDRLKVTIYDAAHHSGYSFVNATTGQPEFLYDSGYVKSWADGNACIGGNGQGRLGQASQHCKMNLNAWVWTPALNAAGVTHMLTTAKARAGMA